MIIKKYQLFSNGVNIIKVLEETLEDDENKCTRCGRTGHYSNKCYAKTNIDNKEII